VAWADVRTHLASADYAWLVPAVVLIVSGQVARAARWIALFGDSARPNLRDAFAILSVGYMISNVMPLRLGDPVRAWLVGTRTPGDAAEALSTVVSERVVDLLTILLLLAVANAESGAALISEVTGGTLHLAARELAVAATLLVLAAVVGLATLSTVADVVGETVTRFSHRWLPRRATQLGRGVSRFLGAFRVMRQPRHALRIGFLSLVVWLIGAAGFWLVGQAFALGITYQAALFAMCAAALFAAFLPPSPGYVGAFHAAVQRSLALYSGTALSAGLSYALVLHAVTFVMLIAMGLVGLWMLGMTTRTLASSVAAGTAGVPQNGPEGS
jgi:uncharacterized protein (TIRG00374 family)